MKYIETGRKEIPIITLLAIWSISLIVNLPGVAISPIMGRLREVFTDSTELEIQLLACLPNLFIIPFVLLSGKLSEGSRLYKMVMVGLLIFIGSGICYLFADRKCTRLNSSHEIPSRMSSSV